MLQEIEKEEAKNGRKIVNDDLLTNIENNNNKHVNIGGEAWVSLTCDNNDWEARELLSHGETWNAETRQVKQV